MISFQSILGVALVYFGLLILMCSVKKHMKDYMSICDPDVQFTNACGIIALFFGMICVGINIKIIAYMIGSVALYIDFSMSAINSTNTPKFKMVLYTVVCGCCYALFASQSRISG